MMAFTASTWASARKLLNSSSSSPPDFVFASRFCILVAISAFITSQGDFTTTRRIAEGLASLAGINRKTRWKYISIMLWKASEFGIGWWLDCTGPEIASLALLYHVPITYVLASASTATSVSSLLVNVLATSGPYYFLHQKPLMSRAPRYQHVGWNGWSLHWISSATAAVLYSLIVHTAAAIWILPYIRRYFPLARQVLRESDLNWKWLLYSVPFISIAVWTFFRVPNHPYFQQRGTEDLKGKQRNDRMYRIEDMRIIKQLFVIILLASGLSWVQLKADSVIV